MAKHSNAENMRNCRARKAGRDAAGEPNARSPYRVHKFKPQTLKAHEAAWDVIDLDDLEQFNVPDLSFLSVYL